MRALHETFCQAVLQQLLQAVLYALGTSRISLVASFGPRPNQPGSVHVYHSAGQNGVNICSSAPAIAPDHSKTRFGAITRSKSITPYHSISLAGAICPIYHSAQTSAPVGRSQRSYRVRGVQSEGSAGGSVYLHPTARSEQRPLSGGYVAAPLDWSRDRAYSVCMQNTAGAFASRIVTRRQQALHGYVPSEHPNDTPDHAPLKLNAGWASRMTSNYRVVIRSEWAVAFADRAEALAYYNANVCQWCNRGCCDFQVSPV